MKRKRRTLFEMEQSVHGAAPRRVAAGGIFPRTRARSFDLGHPVDLRYGDAHAPAAPRNPVAYPAALSLGAGLPAPSAPDDASLSYSVEPFEEEPGMGEPAEPSRAAVAAEPWGGAGEDDEEIGAAQRAEMASLEEDIRAILSQYQSAQGEEEPAPAPVSTPAPAPVLPPAPEAPAAPPAEHPHAVFDQIAQNLAFATTYTLPPVALERRFDEFDRIMDLEGAPSTPPSRPVQEAFAAEDSVALSLDEGELASDLAAIRVLAPEPEPEDPQVPEAVPGSPVEPPGTSTAGGGKG